MTDQGGWTMKTKTFAAVMALAMAGAAPLAADTPTTPMIAEGCAGCHGQAGSGVGQVPRIAGYNRAEFIHVWQEFRDNERPATIMGRIARGYTDDEVAALADYFSSLRAEQ